MDRTPGTPPNQQAHLQHPDKRGEDLLALLDESERRWAPIHDPLSKEHRVRNFESRPELTDQSPPSGYQGEVCKQPFRTTETLDSSV